MRWIFSCFLSVGLGVVTPLFGEEQRVVETEAAVLEVAAVGVSIGITEILGHSGRHGIAFADVSFRDLGRGFAPWFTVAMSSARERFAGVGLTWRTPDQEWWQLRVGLAPGAYGSGDGKNLGGNFQFLSFAELTGALTEAHRFGLRLAHLSNAHLKNINPGTEVVSLCYEYRWR